MKLEGEWWNELHSKMVIKMTGPMTFEGWYHTAVGNAREKKYPLLGRCDKRGLHGQMVAFVVVWNGELSEGQEEPKNPSVTAWCGQLQVIEGKEVITTTWLLDRFTDPKDDWESTLVGMDYFTRREPKTEEVERARRFGRASRAFVQMTR